MSESLAQQAKRIFESQSEFNKWLKELTDEEREHVISMIVEGSTYYQQEAERITSLFKGFYLTSSDYSMLNLGERIAKWEEFKKYHKLAGGEYVKEQLEKEVERLKGLIKEGFVLLGREWDKTPERIESDWQKFKIEHNL